MLRFLASAIFVVFASCSSVAAQPPSTATAYLGEMVPTLMISISSPVVDVEVSNIPPAEMTSASLPEGTRYGSFPVGYGQDATVSFAVWERGMSAPQLLIDANNDENYMDDDWLQYSLQGDAHTYKWFATLQAEFVMDGAVSIVPYHIAVYARYSYEFGQYVYSYVGRSFRKGVLVVGDSLYDIQVATPSSTGRYDEIEKFVIAVDLDRDGVVDDLPYSHEAFAPGDLIELPEGAYQLTTCSIDGKRLTLSRVRNSNPRPVIAVGKIAPEFTTTAIDGTLLRLPDDSFVATILYFLPTLTEATTCTSCGSTDPISDLIDLYQSVYHSGPDVRILAVSHDPPPDSFELDVSALSSGRPASQVEMYVVHDPAINALYRRTQWTFIIDREGRIVAMDEGWYSQTATGGIGGTSRLPRFDLRKIIERLNQAR